jgi:hypothetical protein
MNVHAYKCTIGFLRVFFIVVWAAALLVFIFYWVAFQWGYGAFQILTVWSIFAVPLSIVTWLLRNKGKPVTSLTVLRIGLFSWASLIMLGALMRIIDSLEANFQIKRYIQLSSVQETLSYLTLIVVITVSITMVYHLAKGLSR